MFRIFSRWFRAGRRKHSQVSAAPFERELSDVEILRAHFSPAPHDLSALTDLVRLITKPLDAATTERLVAHVCDAQPGEDASSILHWVLTRDVDGPETIDPSDWCLCICVDWRASDEVEWQANRLLATLRIQDRWISPVGELTVSGAFLDFDVWLAPRGYVLLRLDTGSDEYVAFAIERGDVDDALSLATKAGAVVETSNMFEASTRARS